MPKGPRGEKRPVDVIGAAVKVISTALLIAAAISVAALPAAAQSDGYLSGSSEGYSDGAPVSGDPMSPYVSGSEDGAGARYLDDEDDDARARRGADDGTTINGWSVYDPDLPTVNR